ncbi:MAG: pitrilysin family protein [Polyangiales bacterium]
MSVTTFVETSTDLPLVDLYFITRTGSSHDPAGREGALNLALRTLRRGTRTRTAVEIDAQLDRAGAELSTSCDASSSMLHLTVIRRNLEAALELFAEILTEALLPPEELAQVAREVRADLIDSRDDDRTLAGRFFRRTLFAGHPYGRPSAGTADRVGSLTRDDALLAWRQASRRDNVIIAANGDITEGELRRFAERVSAGLPSEAPLSQEIPAPRAPRGRNLVLVDKPERTQTQIYIGSLGTHARDRDHHALVLGNTIFGGTFSARLMREIRSKRGWSYGASSRLGRDRAREAWSMWTFPAAADAPACVATQLELLSRLIERGVNARELSFARSYLSRGYAFETDTPGKRLWQRIEVDLLDLPDGYYTRYLDKLRAVTLDEVNASLRRRLSSDDLVLSVVCTASEIRGDLERAVTGLKSSRVVPFDTD